MAGGVNLYLHPSNYAELCSQRMLSADGQCKSFGAGGNGFVPGEGVGVILLKPKSRAEADGDHIYGIIKATAINHGGKTSGYTVPSPNAQADLVSKAMSRAKIDARMISYVEAHGTGTELGDPIEISGLTKAFNRFSEPGANGYCAIGSVKSNIGHLEAAAGIAGLTKILLQMQHKQLVPSLHCQTLNPNIDFTSTPFVVQRELSPWHKPRLDFDGNTREYPRLAGLSSFGAGGSNAHLIVEEYQAPIEQPGSQPALLLLSAQSAGQLIEVAQNLLSHVKARAVDDNQLLSLCYTLQVGREAMEVRAAVQVDNIRDLKAKLTAFIRSSDKAADWAQGELKQNKETLASFAQDSEFVETVDKWLARGKYAKLMELWAKGLSFDWRRLYEGEDKPRRMSLPTYPFVKEHYWPDLPEPNRVCKISQGSPNCIRWCMKTPPAVSTTALPPTLTAVNSSLPTMWCKAPKFCQAPPIWKWRARLSPEPWNCQTTKPSHSMMWWWLRPVVMPQDDQLTLHISIALLSETSAEYDIYTIGDDGEELIYSQGRGEVLEDSSTAPLDLASMSGEALYNGETIYPVAQ